LKEVKKKSVENNLNMKDPKIYWKTVNQELGLKLTNNIELKEGDNLITNVKRILEIFAQTFQQKITNNIAKLDQSDPPDNTTKIQELKPFIHKDILCSND